MYILNYLYIYYVDICIGIAMPTHLQMRAYHVTAYVWAFVYIFVYM